MNQKRPTSSHERGIILEGKYIDRRVPYLSSLPVGLSRGPTVCCGGGIL